MNGDIYLCSEQGMGSTFTVIVRTKEVEGTEDELDGLGPSALEGAASYIEIPRVQDPVQSRLLEMRERDLKNVFVLFTGIDTTLIFQTYLEAAKIEAEVFHTGSAWEASPFTDFDSENHLVTIIVEFSYLKQLKKILRAIKI